MERRLVCQGYFATTCFGGIKFDYGRVEQIADFNQCRLLFGKDGSPSELSDALLQQAVDPRSPEISPSQIGSFWLIKLLPTLKATVPFLMNAAAVFKSTPPTGMICNCGSGAKRVLINSSPPTSAGKNLIMFAPASRQGVDDSPACPPYPRNQLRCCTHSLEEISLTHGTAFPILT
jgi:hypothetical protein